MYNVEKSLIIIYLLKNLCNLATKKKNNISNSIKIIFYIIIIISILL